MSSSASQAQRKAALLPSTVLVKLVPLTPTKAATCAPSTVAARALRFSSTTRFFFCGIMLEVPATLSGKRSVANS